MTMLEDDENDVDHDDDDDIAFGDDARNTSEVIYRRQFIVNHFQ